MHLKITVYALRYGPKIIMYNKYVVKLNIYFIRIYIILEYNLYNILIF
jgi:hypothetical protein